MRKLLVLLGFSIMAASAYSQTAIVPASTGHGAPSFNCAQSDTYQDIDSGIVWICKTQNSWVPYPAFQPFGTSPVAPIIDKGGQVYDVRAYGALCNGSHDDTAAIAAAATASSGGVLFIPPAAGACTTSAPVVLPASSSMRIDGTLKATAAMAEVVNIGGAGRALRQTLYGTGIIDSNNLAQRHILMSNFGHFEITGVTLFNSASIAGIDMQGSANYEPFIHDMNLFVPSGTPDTVGNVGIWVDTATDASVGPNIAVVGWDTCVKDSVGGNQPFKDIHCWGATNNLPNTCFDSAHGNAQWVNDECDTSTAIGVRGRQFNDIIDNFRCYNNSTFGTDNTLNCIQFDQGSPNSVVTNALFQGADSSHRIGTDISASSFANIISVGNQIVANVVNQNSVNQNFNNFVVQPAALNINRQGALDVGYSFNLNSGSSAAQTTNLNFMDRNAFKWDISKDASNAFQIFDVVQNANRIRMLTSGDITFTDVAGAKFIFAGGMVMLSPTGSQPTCALAIEGALWYAPGSGSTNGALQVCQNQSGTFSWVTH